MGKRKKLHEISLHEDTRYQGPISFMGFQMLGWLCLVFTAASRMLSLAAQADPTITEDLGIIPNILSTLASLSLPLLLIANFSRILSETEGYKKQLLRNGAAALAIFLVVNIFFSRYIVGTISMFVTDPEDVEPTFTELLGKIVTNNFVAFNIFIDLFLCSLFMFFLHARPKRVFTGKKVILFRMMAILPVAYEIGCMLLKGMAAAGDIVLPVGLFPLLTVKPPMTFVVFMILALHLKARERRFRKTGRSYEEYQAFLETRRNSRHFSIFLCILLAVTAIVDIFNLIFITAFTAVGSDSIDAENEEEIVRLMNVMVAMGFGKSIPQLLAAPVMLLFSYTRKPKYQKYSMWVPIVGMALMAIVVLEGIHLLMGALSQDMGQVSLNDLRRAFVMGTRPGGIPAMTSLPEMSNGSQSMELYIGILTGLTH